MVSATCIEKRIFHTNRRAGYPAAFGLSKVCSATSRAAASQHGTMAIGQQATDRIGCQGNAGQKPHVFKVTRRPAAHAWKGVLHVTGQSVDDLGAPALGLLAL